MAGAKRLTEGDSPSDVPAPAGDGRHRDSPDPALSLRRGDRGTRRHASDLPPGRPASRLTARLARGLRQRLTPQEARLWVALRPLRPAGFHFRRQVAIGSVVVDFACLTYRLIVECDGGQHGRDDHARMDGVRDEALARLGFRVLRFWNSEVDRNLAGVMDTIVAALEAARPHPGPPLRSGSALPSGEGEHGRLP